jgi:hypothetical protein
MDAELQALNAAIAAAATHGWQVILLDEIDGEWVAAAGIFNYTGEERQRGTGPTRTAALQALTAALEGA